MVWFFKRGEKYNAVRSYLLEIKKFYTEAVDIRLKTNLPKESKLELKNALMAYNSTINQICNSLENHDIKKAFEAFSVAATWLKVLDDILNFRESEGNYSVPMLKLTENMLIILRLSGKKMVDFNEIKKDLNLEDHFEKENLNVWGLSEYLRYIKKEILKCEKSVDETLGDIDKGILIGNYLVSEKDSIYPQIKKFPVFFKLLENSISKKLKDIFDDIVGIEIRNFLEEESSKLDYEIIKVLGIDDDIEPDKLDVAEYDESRFYFIPKELILSSTTQNYRTFLKEAGYGDLDSCEGILIEKKISKTNITWYEGRKLVEDQGYKLLTTALMYKVFIPWIKSQASKGNKDAQKTLKEMINSKAEWLNDLILNKNTLKIENKEVKLSLPQKDGRFDRDDLNEFGYPLKVEDKGEFHYWYPRGDKMVVIRNWGFELGLDINGTPSGAVDGLGVRRAKFFP